MMKYFAHLLVVGLMLPNVAMADTLRLPSDARIDVQVIDTLSLKKTEPSHDNVLLKPVVGQGAEHELPAHCLITADAQLVDGRARLSANTVTCIDMMGDTREIYSGDFSAAARESNGEFGIDVICTETNEQGCQRAQLPPTHVFQLELGQALAIEAQDNPSERLNEQRLQSSETSTPSN